MTTVAFIPVRGGSKSIPGKNIKLLAGRPLLHWTLSAALDAENIDHVFVSSDDDEILEAADRLRCEKLTLLKRRPELASDTASTESVLLDFADTHTFEHVVLIQATSPLTTSDDLNRGVELVVRGTADSALSGTHEHRFRWHSTEGGLVEPVNYDPRARPRRQDWAGELVENGAFYVTSRERLLTSRCRISGRIAFHAMPAATAMEIDTPEDWTIVEELLQKMDGGADALDQRRLQCARERATKIRLLVTDVDGALTDAGMYYGARGEELKKFNTKDGMGTKLWKQSGHEVAIVTGENAPSVARRAEKLKISEVHLGIADKLPVVRKLAADRGLRMEQVAYLGDDVNDLEAMRAVGLSGCPSDAHVSVRAISDFVAPQLGGGGVLRSFVDFMLEAQAKRVGKNA